MPYTLWSRGRLLGETTLGYAPSIPRLRAGDFLPTELGERLMPVITGVGPALRALFDVVNADRASGNHCYDQPGADFPEHIKRTPEYADSVSIQHELESLALELRDPDGRVVPTESIALQDTEYLLSLPPAPDELFDETDLIDDEDVAADLELLEAMWSDQPDGFDDDDTERPPPARYQIFVTLTGAVRTVHHSD